MCKCTQDVARRQSPLGLGQPPVTTKIIPPQHVQSRCYGPLAWAPNLEPLFTDDIPHTNRGPDSEARQKKRAQTRGLRTRYPYRIYSYFMMGYILCITYYIAICGPNSGPLLQATKQPDGVAQAASFSMHVPASPGT